MAELACVVLAGGAGQRMGGADKGLQDYRGQPLVHQVLNRLQHQQGVPPLPLGINANRHLAQYAALGIPVWDDGQDGFGGPLQGMLASLRAVEQHFAQAQAVLFTACDTPHLPLDLANRLRNAMQQTGARAAAVRAQGRTHPLPCLLDRELQGSLAIYLGQGQRKVQAWLETCGVQWVDFDGPGDQSEAFANFNTLAELQNGQGH